MADIAKIRRESRARRHRRIRARLAGTSERPRLAVRRSLRHIYAQLIDDVAAETLASVSTLDKGARSTVDGKSRIDASRELGKLLAERAKSKGIDKVKFDRGGNLYHGHIKALAEGAREGGLEL